MKFSQWLRNEPWNDGAYAAVADLREQLKKPFETGVLPHDG